MLLRFWDQLAAATTVLQRALDAAGTPSVDNGAKIVSTVHAAFARLLAGIAKLRSETASLPTDSRADFTSAQPEDTTDLPPTLDAISMRTRHYIAPSALLALRPLFRYSASRDAYVVRVVGNRWGPVLRRDRRRTQLPTLVPERRGSSAI